MNKLRYFLPLALAVCAPGQTVEGTVINSVTGVGIGGAKVMLQQGQTSGYSATTDATGHFLVEDVKDGPYSVRFEAEGYFSPSRRDAPLQVRAGASPVRIAGRLLPFARIGGIVTDPNGRAVLDAVVELTTPQTFLTARTDDKGRFSIDSVIPGANYTLQVEPPPGLKPPDSDPERPLGWAPTFYPGVSRREQASPLALEPGSNLQDLKIKLLAVPTHSVRGVLLNRDNSGAPNVSLVLWETGPRRRAAYHAESKANGGFEFTTVADGEWRLHAELKSQASTLLADEWIEVRGRDLESVKVRLAAPLIVSGRVILETPEGVAAPSAPSVLLIKQHGGQILFSDQAIFTARPVDGRFRFEGLYPGSYVLQPVGPPPTAYYLDSIQQGVKPVWDGVEKSDGSSDLAIVYKTHGGNVNGAVEKCNSGQVLLVRQDRPRSAQVGYCDASDRFQFSAVRPGEYYAVAVPDLGQRPVDAALLQGATRVTVRAGETTQVNLSIR